MNNCESLWTAGGLTPARDRCYSPSSLWETSSALPSDPHRLLGEGCGCGDRQKEPNWYELECESALLCVPGPDTDVSILVDRVISMLFSCGCLSYLLDGHTTLSPMWRGTAVQGARLELLPSWRQSPLEFHPFVY